MNTQIVKASEIQDVETVPQPQPMDVVHLPTAAERRVEQVHEALEPAYSKGSELQLTPEECKALRAPFRDEDIEIRPHDGLLYIPHITISDRLNDVLGPGQWCMIRRREWVEGNRIYAEYVMKIRGCFIGESVGAMDYFPNNAKMNYSDALEGTRGECIRRIAGKDLGCGSQVWKPSFCRQWQAKYACQVGGKWQRRLPVEASVKQDPSVKQSPLQNAPKANPAPKNDLPAASPDAWKDMECPKRFKKLDGMTLGLLATSNDPKLRQSLYWLIDTFKAEPWQGNDGQMRPPNPADIAFRAALNDAKGWVDARKAEKETDNVPM